MTDDMIKEAILERAYLPHVTLGKLILPTAETLVTLELPWRNNEVSVSCIPEGRYLVTRNTTGRHQWYAINDVKGRTFIEIHPAECLSSPRTGKPLLEGCVAPALKVRKNHYAGTSGSQDACKKLLAVFGDDDWYLDIRHQPSPCQ